MKRTYERKFCGQTTLDDTTTDETFSILKAYFEDVEQVDKYPTAAITGIVKQSVDKVMKHDNRERISKKKLQRIRDLILFKLRHRYGKWINLLNFKLKRNSTFEFETNFSTTYRTKKGLLYGHAPESSLRQMFFTAHSLQRFDERVKLTRYDDFRKKFKRQIGAYPTAADILYGLVLSSSQFGNDPEPNHRLINIHFGSLVVETFRNIFIVKTFITPDMVKRDVEWFELEPNQFELEGKAFDINSVQAFFDHKVVPCTPEFLEEEWTLDIS